jgi:hypothetical protein
VHLARDHHGSFSPGQAGVYYLSPST